MSTSLKSISDGWNRRGKGSNVEFISHLGRRSVQLEQSERDCVSAVPRFRPQHTSYISPNDTLMSKVKLRVIDHNCKSKLTNRVEGYHDAAGICKLMNSFL